MHEDRLTGSSGSTEGALWAWAVATYERPGVKDALLALQNRHGVDVVLLLWRLWLSTTGRRLDPAAEARAVAFSTDWRARIVAPLRAARDNLKTPPTPVESEPAQRLRKEVLAAELAAEKLQLDALEAQSGGPAQEPSAPRDVLGVLAKFPELTELPPTDLIALAKALEAR